MSDRWIVTFESVYYVMKAEKLFKENGFNVSLIPTPREISSDCSMAIELFGEKLDAVKNFLEEKGLWGQISTLNIDN